MRGRPVVRWKIRVKTYKYGRGADRGEGIQHARRECMDRER